MRSRWAAQGELRERFRTDERLTLGIEEEVLLVDRSTWMPAPIAARVIEAAADPRVKAELPACQVELATSPHRTVAGAMAELAAARALLVRTCDDAIVPVAAAVHPLAGGPMEIAPSTRARSLVADYGTAASRQLVGSMQVHVAVGDPDATLAVYNALRGHLPELAALAAAAPFHEGHDTGMASVRPLIAGQLPRQGVPPSFSSWDAFFEELRWGAATGWVGDAGRWWWELRPHVGYGTLEVRVPDVQPSIAAATGVAALVHGLVSDLAERHAAGEDLGAPPRWRIEENRWSALRDGVHGQLADLVTGALEPTRDRLARLIEVATPYVPDGLDQAQRLLEQSSADSLRTAGLHGALPWLAETFAPPAQTAPVPAGEEGVSCAS
jgi:carboxylate-amine ligase